MFSIYDILQEADGDENQNNPHANDNNNNAAGNDTQQQTNTDTNNQQNNPAPDDDFNMDMSLQDDTDGGDDTGEDTGDDMDTGDTTDVASSGEGEPVEANTDIFSALSAEEQITKIMELKKQYSQLYNSCDDLIEKISNIENTEASVAPMSKLVNTLTDLKQYITDYFYNRFDVMSYYENDVKLNFLLSIFYSVREVLESVYRINSQNTENIEGKDRT